MSSHSKTQQTNDTPPKKKEKKKRAEDEWKQKHKQNLLMYISLLLWHMFKLCYVAGLWEEGTHVMEGPLS